MGSRRRLEFYVGSIDVVLSLFDRSSPIVMGKPEIISTSISGAKHYIHHGFSNPSEVGGSDEEKTLAFRRTRDEIKQWLISKFASPKTANSDADP